MSFGLTALFAAVTAVAVVAGAARMPLLVGILFATDGLVFAVGIQYLHTGFDPYRRIETSVHDLRAAKAQLRFGLFLIAFAVATFGAAKIVHP